MADKIRKAIAAITGAVSTIRFVSPFKVTGVASSSEFKHYLDKAPDYRSHAPASQPIKAIVPQAESHLIYDIKYANRDTRRSGMIVGGTNKTHLVTTEFDPASVKAEPGLRGFLVPNADAGFAWRQI